MSLLRTYRDIYAMKKTGIEKRRDHLKVGTSKLNEAKEMVDKLKSNAAEQRKLLAEKQAEADNALQQITTSMTSTSDQKMEMEALKEKMEQENKKLSKRKKEIDLELAQIEPLIQEAKAAVGSIKSDALSEIRSLRAPPDVIRDILEGVLRLMGIFDTSWVSMKSFLAKRGVKEEILGFDVRSVTPEIRQSVQELLVKNQSSFDVKNAKRASAAAAPLASWVQANVKYAEVLQKIGPLEAEQAKLKKNLSTAERRMDKLGSALEDVDQEVSRLRDRLNQFTKEAAQIEINLRSADETIGTAEEMVLQLEGEYQRWTKQLAGMEEELSQLPRRCLLASAFLTYLPAQPEEVRGSFVGRWCQMLSLADFRLCSFLGSEKEQLTWKAEGLPADPLSLENAVLLLQSSLCPFVIDPSSQATEWLKRHLKDLQLEVATQRDSNFLTTLELSVRFGKSLLVRDVDYLEPILYPLLRRDLINQGSRCVVQIGDKTVDYNENFKLFLVTQNASVVLPPFATSLVMTVNFTTTRAGLSEQLLQTVLGEEKPELERRRSDLLREEEDLRVRLSQLEDSLLEQLVSSQGDLLANRGLLSSLHRTKASSLGIEAALGESHRLQEALDQERKAYLPLAHFGSELYFLTRQLVKLNHMYVFSLASFLRLFISALKQSTSGNKGEKHLKQVQKSFLQLVYEHICRSLFKKDRIAFSLHLVHGMFPHLFKENEWEVFTGMLVTDAKFDKESVRAELPGWIEDERALAVALLKNLFPELSSALQLENQELWRGFAESSHCEREIPEAVAKRLTLFQQTLLVQALRPDRLVSALTLFVSRVLGLRELSPQALNFQRLHAAESGATEPILIVTSPSVDASQELLDVANAVRGSNKYHQVSMGQGQMDLALEYLKTCAQEGSWLCLTNLHLVIGWLPRLVKEIAALRPHQDFRLWLTTEAHPKFSSVLLEMCLKVTYEAPPGVKRNLQRTYSGWTPQTISVRGNLLCSQAYFVLAWFHAIVQERRTYIPQGWTKFYEFSLADLKAGADIVDRLCRKESGTVEWEFLRGLFETAVYGGRVDNPFDMRVLRSYLGQFFDSAVVSGTPRSKRNLAPSVAVPTAPDYEVHLKVIEQIADEDSPAYFGLPSNIDRSVQRTLSAQAVSQLRTLARPSEAAGKLDVQGWSSELSPVLNLWKKLNQGSQLIQTRLPATSDPPEGSRQSPIESFLKLEHRSGIRLVQEIHATLASLSKVIRGTALLTAEVKEAATALVNHQVPAQWLKRWEGPEEPLPFLRGVVGRALAVGGWIHKFDAGTLLRDPLELSDLFRPDTFLNALRQQTAREAHVPVDGLHFVTSWKGGIAGATLTVTLSGLQLEGCSFDGLRLAQCRHNSPSVSSVPACLAAWLPKSSPPPYPEAGSILLPLYSGVEREKVVATLSLPCDGDRNQWLQCGAALFLKSV
ncbi:cytoplasmic dynein 2 heavy chain 1 [Ixodes scapularis]|uniref:cytoplasmic dynein 2 heavy chain 1 n=1 Tax=Ixodes scapularis TaxID=6945 RepID=UPI001A9D9357|nr:cytoplasmic dynein 2 heavy chain 1 [Ixodes scapularis]